MSKESRNFDLFTTEDFVYAEVDCKHSSVASVVIKKLNGREFA
jgi:hypothetical protein